MLIDILKMLNIDTKQEREHKGKSLIDFTDNYVVVDLETTGYMPEFDSIIEIGAIKYINNIEVDRFHTFVSGCVIDDFVTAHTGITNDMLVNAPPIKIALANLLDFISDNIIIAHNANFDVNFIYDNSKQVLNFDFKNDFIDTLRIARRIKLDTPNCKLSTLAKYFNINQSNQHRSIPDCETTQLLYLKLREYINLNNISFKKSYNTPCKISNIQSVNDNIDISNPFYNKVVVFTGALDSMQRKDAAQIVANLGGILGDSVTKNTNYLILGDFAYCSTIKNGKSAKYKKAENLIIKGQDLQIIPEKVFLSMIKEEV